MSANFSFIKIVGKVGPDSSHQPSAWAQQLRNCTKKYRNDRYPIYRSMMLKSRVQYICHTIKKTSKILHWQSNSVPRPWSYNPKAYLNKLRNSEIKLPYLCK